MKCYELNNDALVEGLLIADDAGLPRICLNEKQSFPLSAASIAIYERQPKIAPIRAKYMMFMKGDSELTFSKKVDRVALVRVDVKGGVGGKVTCTACSFSQVQTDAHGVEKSYHMFPPPGVTVLGDPPLEDALNPWEEGAERLELAVMMVPGSSFRVHRTGHLRGARKNMYVAWDGCELLITPLKQNAMKEAAGGEQLSL